MTKTDRQAVLHNPSCVRCHVEPAAGAFGEGLFVGACAVCHASARRAEMVPDLRVAAAGRDDAYWRQWITEGKPGTLMPAFAVEKSGILSTDQVDSLVEYCRRTFVAAPH